MPSFGSTDVAVRGLSETWGTRSPTLAFQKLKLERCGACFGGVYFLATEPYVIVAEFGQGHGQGPQLLVSRLLIGNYGGLKAGRTA